MSSRRPNTIFTQQGVCASCLCSRQIGLPPKKSGDSHAALGGLVEDEIFVHAPLEILSYLAMAEG